MSSNMLGQIANVHMALCDLRVLGPRDPDCKELALQHFIEVDAPKTGKKGTIARDLIPNAYPHFMEKGDKQSYLSVKVLGQLYDFCSSVPLDHSILPSTDSVDPRFLVNDYEKYLQSAQNTADAYRLEITALMKLYGIQEESQLITGCLTELPLHLRDERHQISRDVMKQFKEISNRYKKLFLEEFEDKDKHGVADNIDEVLKKASCWYYVAYSSSPVLHSFAWIVSEYLVKLPNLPNMETFSDQINKSIEDYIKQLKPELIAGYAKRIHMKSEVEKVLKEKQSNLQIQLFGSSAILLFEPTSDVDVAVFPSTYNGSTNDALSKEQQLKVLKEISSSLPFKNVKLQEEPAVPVIKCEDDLIAPSETTPFSLDISVNPEGVLKRDILFTLLAEYPFLYPLFYFVCKWGRDSGIILHSRDSLLSTFHLICLMISYCSEKKLIDMQKILSNYHKRSYVEEVGFWERFLTSIDYSQQDLYSLILGFFTKYATASSIVVAEPLGKRHTIDTAKVATLRNIFTRSMHFLALNNDISNMLKICRERKGSSEVIMSVRLSTLLRYGYSERHFLEHVSKTSGATLSILKYGTAAFQLKISGNNGVIQKAIKDINDIQSLFYKLPKPVRGRHVEGSTVVYFLGANSDSDTLKMLPYNGSYNVQHALRPLNSVSLERGPHPTLLSTHYLDSRFTTKLSEQLQKLSEFYQPHHGKLNIEMRLGSIYFINFPHHVTNSPSPFYIHEFNELLAKKERGKQIKESDTNKTTPSPSAKNEQQLNSAKSISTKKKTTASVIPARSVLNSRLSHSFYTWVTNGAQLIQWLKDKYDFCEYKQKERYVLSQKNPDKHWRYNEHKEPINARSSPLRWLVTDFKGLEEQDFRICIQTVRLLEEQPPKFTIDLGDSAIYNRRHVRSTMYRSKGLEGLIAVHSVVTVTTLMNRDTHEEFEIRVKLKNQSRDQMFSTVCSLWQLSLELLHVK